MLALLTTLPMWVKVGAGMGLLMGVMWTANWWNTRDLKRDLASTQQQLKTTQEDAAKAAAEYARNAEREEANRKEQQAAIDKQNQRIAANAARVREVEATAAMTAFRASEESKLIADALRDKSSPIPVGPDGINVWFQQQFPGVTK